jgi:hypothetical protein
VVLTKMLGASCAIRVWNEAFEAKTTDYFMHILQEVSVKDDFAIIILTPDDMSMKDGTEVTVARNNVVLEMGLFIGNWGLNRVFQLRIDKQDLHITDLDGIEVALLKWRGSCDLPPDKARQKTYNTRMRQALRRDVVTRVEQWLHRIGRRGLKAPFSRIANATRELETTYRHGETADRIFLNQLGTRMGGFNDTLLEPAQAGQITLIPPEEKALPDLLRDAKHSAKAVAHYRNINWWQNNIMAEDYLRVHDELRDKVQIHRIFILPATSLKDRHVRYAIKQSCLCGVKVQLLLWQTDGMELDQDMKALSHPARTLVYDQLPGPQTTVGDNMSFLIIDDKIVSYSNIPDDDKDAPSQLYVNVPEKSGTDVNNFIDTFDNLSRLAVWAKRFFPKFCA